MQEYAIDKGIRGRVTIILFTISILLTVLIRQSGIGDKLMTGFVYILKLGKINETVDILGFVPDILGVPFWYGVMWGLFNNYAWKCKIFQKFHSVPDISGMWKGELISCYDKSVKHPMKLKVSQTWSQIHFTAIFEKSSSESNIAAILSENTEHPVIYFGSQNRSKDMDAHKQIYDGYNRIELIDNKMDGSYSNDRPSNDPNLKDGNCGTFTLTRVITTNKKGKSKAERK